MYLNILKASQSITKPGIGSISLPLQDPRHDDKSAPKSAHDKSVDDLNSSIRTSIPNLPPKISPPSRYACAPIKSRVSTQTDPKRNLKRLHPHEQSHITPPPS